MKTDHPEYLMTPEEIKQVADTITVMDLDPTTKKIVVFSGDYMTLQEAEKVMQALDPEIFGVKPIGVWMRTGSTKDGLTIIDIK